MATKVYESSIVLSSTSVTTADFPAISFQTGDFIIVRGSHGATAGADFVSVTDTPGNAYPLTRLSQDKNGNNYQFNIAYMLSAPSSGADVVFRVTWATAISGCRYYIQVWRPTAGAVMQVDAAKAFMSGTSTLTPITPTINSSANALVLAVINTGFTVAKSNPLIGAQTADTSPYPLIDSGNAIQLLQTFFSAAQTGIFGQLTLNSAFSYISNILSFKEYASSVDQSYTGQGIVVGGGGTASQEVFTGGIG